MDSSGLNSISGRTTLPNRKVACFNTTLTDKWLKCVIYGGEDGPNTPCLNMGAKHCPMPRNNPPSCYLQSCAVAIYSMIVATLHCADLRNITSLDSFINITRRSDLALTLSGV
ncbi:hypothetical protein AVEN_170350-1 [Araneus ventricosus]|uniref:Uncharacterized protein n=1 Tax=Araneus ventricosus TaxID=182803 RepID=A0A4Y2CA41_ARAVE|nr:hypothetical protein AVEN_170350-1 [Araneus ventricosus]